MFGQDYAYLIAAHCGAHFPDQNWTFLNRGISGNKVTDLAGRWQSDTLNLKPDILSILIGVNDSGSVVGSGGNGGVTAEQYEQVYDQILQQTLAANPNIKFVLCEPFVGQTGHVLEKPDSVERGDKKAAGRRGTISGQISRPGRPLPEDV